MGPTGRMEGRPTRKGVGEVSPDVGTPEGLTQKLATRRATARARGRHRALSRNRRAASNPCPILTGCRLLTLTQRAPCRLPSGFSAATQAGTSPSWAGFGQSRMRSCAKNPRLLHVKAWVLSMSGRADEAIPLIAAMTLLRKASVLHQLGERERAGSAAAVARTIIENCADPGILSEELETVERLQRPAPGLGGRADRARTHRAQAPSRLAVRARDRPRALPLSQLGAQPYQVDLPQAGRLLSGRGGRARGRPGPPGWLELAGLEPATFWVRCGETLVRVGLGIARQPAATH